MIRNYPGIARACPGLQAPTIPRLSHVGEKKRVWYTLFTNAPSSLGNLHITLGELSMYLLPVSFFSAHTQESENKAKILP